MNTPKPTKSQQNLGRPELGGASNSPGRRNSIPVMDTRAVEPGRGEAHLDSPDLISETENLVEYDAAFPEALIAQGRDTRFLALYKLDEPYQRADGKRVRWSLDYRWLSVPCRHEKDESWCCVRGSENTYWSLKELQNLAVLDSTGKLKTDDLFKHFHLF